MHKLRTLLAVCALASSGLANGVTDLTAFHRDGQTFVTWTELADDAATYRVYRGTTPLGAAADLDGAELLGEVDAQSSFNARRSAAEGTLRHWVIVSGGSELTAQDGLFVHTALESASAWYAVTPVQAGVEDRAIVAGVSALAAPVAETPSAPQPVRQVVQGNTTVWAHWASDRPSPHQAALAPWPSTPYLFTLRRAIYPGLRGLVVRLHAEDKSYANGWPAISSIAPDVHVLSLDDGARGVHTHWLGLRAGWPAPAAAGELVLTCTLRRAAWTVAWAKAFMSATHDVERTYAVGSGSGAGGVLRLVADAPSDYAAALCRKPALDLGAGDVASRATLDALFGPVALDLDTDTGLAVWDLLDAAVLASLAPGEAWPVVRTVSGRFDAEAGWSAAPAFFAAMAAQNRSAAHYFDASTHDGLGYWSALETTLLWRTMSHRAGRPTLAFDGLDLDDDPGAGSPVEGDEFGAVAAYADHAYLSGQESPDELAFEVFLRDEFSLDDAPAPLGRARLAPRGTGTFAPALGDFVRYTLEENGLLVDEHLLRADADGLLRTPPSPLVSTPRTARFERWTATPEEITVFVASVAEAGEAVQVVIVGRPALPWRALALAAPSPSGAPQMEPVGTWRNVVWSAEGVLDARGEATFAVTVPAPLARAGRRVAIRVDVDGRTVATAPVDFR